MWFSFERSLVGSSEASDGGSSTFESQTGSYTTTGDVTQMRVSRQTRCAGWVWTLRTRPPASSSMTTMSASARPAAERGSWPTPCAMHVANAAARVPSADDIARLTSLLSMMADPVRLRILYTLDVAEELYVGDLALALAVNEDQVTYALRLLRTAGLVHAHKRGRVVCNRLADDLPQALRQHCLHQLVQLSREATDDGN